MNTAERQNLSQVFREEAFEQLDLLNASILKLEQETPTREHFELILRTAHSLKGGAKLMGAAPIEKVVHSFESLMVEVNEGRLAISRECIDTLLDSIDSIRNELGGVQHAPGRDPDTVAGRLLNLAARGPELPDFVGSFPTLSDDTAKFLTESQKSTLLVAKRNQNSIFLVKWTISWDAYVKDFVQNLKILSEAATVVGMVAGTPPSDRKIVFDILYVCTKNRAVSTASFTNWDVVISELTHATPAAATAPELKLVVDAEDEFTREMALLLVQYIAEHLDEFDDFSKDIIKLDKTPKDQELIHGLFRRAHSLKGTGTSFGLPSVSEFSHRIETVLDGLRSEKLSVTPNVIDCLLRASDELKLLFEHAKAGNTTVKPSAQLVAELEGLAAGRPTVVGTVTPEANHNAAAPTTPGKETLLTPVAAIKPTDSPAARESIRVRLEKLDRMVNLASELTLDKNARETLIKELSRVYGRFQRLHRRWQEIVDRFVGDTAHSPELSVSSHVLSNEIHQGMKSFDQDLGQCSTDFISHSERSATMVYALQNEVLRIRMVPISLLFDSAPRLVRDLTRDGKKQISLELKGASTELDKRVLEQMSDPLIHLIRNAVDHGIETANERILAGKPGRGTIELSAEQRGSQILITIRDDGRGIDAKRVLAKARTMGIKLPKNDAEMTPEDTYPLIFLPGFSTKDAVTEISGRGVGMDVVKKNIESLKGEVSIESTPGKGACFQIYLPVSLAVIQAVLVSAGGHDIYFPTDSVVEIAEVAEEEFQPIDGKPTINRRNITVPLESLARIFGAPENRPKGGKRTILFVHGVVRGRREVFGFFIDAALEEHSIVLKEPNLHFRKIRHMAGVTIRPDGTVALVIDTTSLISHALGLEGKGWTVQPASSKEPTKRYRLLVCDDTHTSRELFRTLLETAGYDVVTAKDGKMGFGVVEKGKIDLVVSDIQMPEMDGYELVAKIKADARYKGTPVVLVSSLSKDEEKLRGMQAGANAYIVKGSFDQNNLISTVERLLG